MAKLHIKKGDTVFVNAGASKGKTGRVLEVLVEKQRAIVEGVNMVSKSTKPNKSEGQAVLGRQFSFSTPWLTERHGYDPTSP